MSNQLSKGLCFLVYKISYIDNFIFVIPKGSSLDSKVTIWCPEERLPFKSFACLVITKQCEPRKRAKL